MNTEEIAKERKPLRLLVVSDDVAPTLFNARIREHVGPVDLLLSCGDLSYSYLEYIVTRLRTPHAFYVHGNHDSPEYRANNTTLEEPGGWMNLDQRSVWLEELGLLIAGLEGSIRYRPEAPYQYTQREMTWRVYRLAVKLLFNYLRHGRYLDIFVAHSPPAGIHDGTDWPHRGFEAYLGLMKRFRPRLFLHGHKHRYGPGPWRSQYRATEVVNVHPFRIINWYEDEIQYGRLSRR